MNADYEERKQKWIAEQLANCPPLNEQQKLVIRTAFAAHRIDTGEAGAV